MKYQDYFSMFLNVEGELLKFIKIISYSGKHKNIYANKLVLMLLQTCPIIESYLVRLTTSSNTVKQSSIWNSDIKAKIWEVKKDKSIKVSSNGDRQIANFPKFACLSNEVFKLDDKIVDFYHSDLFQESNGCGVSSFTPFNSLSKTLLTKDKCYLDKTSYPKGYETPKWWTAYNKIKHSFDDAAQEQVNYSIVIEALAALFCVLAYCEPDIESLEGNGYLKSKVLKSKLFKTKLVGLGK